MIYHSLVFRSLSSDECTRPEKINSMNEKLEKKGTDSVKHIGYV